MSLTTTEAHPPPLHPRVSAQPMSPRPISMIGDRFRTVIAQPATLCNLDCGYCYLPDRKRQTLMPVKVAQRLAASIAEQGSEFPVELVWHGGEPLTTPVAHMRALLAEFEPVRQGGRLAHAVQTNATLVSQPWIELFGEYGFRVGVSLDGPESMNVSRVDWAGRDSFAKTMTGIERLRQAGIDFSAICVVTAATIGRADELLDFFADLGCASVGFNIEEQEGLNAHRQQVTPEQAQEFWAALWARRERVPHLRIRDLDRLRGWLGHAQREGAQPPGVYDPIPTVAATGQVVVLSPELLGVTAPEYGDFVIGNVLTETLQAMMSRLPQVGYVAEFDSGLRRCADECDFWAFCGGAQAGNRFFEHGRFDTTETNYCATTYQSVVRSALDHTRKATT